MPQKSYVVRVWHPNYNLGMYVQKRFVIESNKTIDINVILEQIECQEDGICLHLIHPIGEKILASGEPIEIRWTQQNIHQTYISYLKCKEDNDRECTNDWITTIPILCCNSIMNGEQKIIWSVPVLESDEYLLIKIRGYSHAFRKYISDVSDTPFKVYNDPKVTFTVDDYETGTKLHNAIINIVNHYDNNSITTLYTDMNGQATRDMNLGQYTITITKDGYYSDTFYYIQDYPQRQVNIKLRVGPSIPAATIVSAKLIDSNSDYAGAWNVFAPGRGRANRTSNDWHWKINLETFIQKAIQSIVMRHNEQGEGWSTSSAIDPIYNKQLYPLVIYAGNTQLNKSYDTTITLNDPFYELDLYGQVERPKFQGGRITIYYMDGTSISADINASDSIKAPYSGYTLLTSQIKESKKDGFKIRKTSN